MKYVGINLTNYVQNLYSKYCKTFLREVKENVNKWKEIHCSLIGKFNIVKDANFYPINL